MDRGFTDPVQLSPTEAEGKRDSTGIYTEGDGVFPSADGEADRGISKERRDKEEAPHRTEERVPAKVYR